MNPTCTLTNLNTRIRSSTLYANARTPLDSIWSNFRRPPEKSHLQPQVSEKSYHHWLQAVYQDKYECMGEFDLMRLAFLLDQMVFQWALLELKEGWRSWWRPREDQAPGRTVAARELGETGGQPRRP